MWFPCNWSNFFNNAIESIPPPANNGIALTDGPGVICIPTRDTTSIAPCDHEEADTRIMLHIADAVGRGYSKILVRIVETGVVVLAEATVMKLGVSEVWVAFGTGRDYRYIAAHEIAASLGPIKSVVSPMFHAYTGCDTVASFA